MSASLPTAQRAILITAPGGPEVLKLITQPVPQPAEGEVLIKVGAAGINRHDTGQRMRGPGKARSDVPGLEVAGSIVAVGAGVPASHIGERVCALIDGGGYAEYATAPAALALPIPNGFDDLAAAGIPEAIFTAWYNVMIKGRLQQDEILLIHGGASGVGSLAIMVLSRLGYKVMATCGNAEKCDAALGFGAFAAFDYNSPSLADDIKAKAGDGRIGVIFDMSGGAHVDVDLDVIGRGGRIVHINPGRAKSPMQISAGKLMAKEIWISGSLMRPLPVPDKIRIAEQLKRDVWPILDAKVRPAIYKVFPLADAAGAHAEMERNAHIGKIMLVP